LGHILEGSNLNILNTQIDKQVNSFINNGFHLLIRIMAKSQNMDTAKHLKGDKTNLWRKNSCTKSKYASICSILLCLLNYEVM